jgi:tetratricopeptide (TPR) repeat protein
MAGVRGASLGERGSRSAILDRRPSILDPQSVDQWTSVVGQLLKRQFLIEDGGGFRFGHDTLREVIYDDLDEATRQSLHLRAAEALEREHYARVEALAQHLYLAGAWEKSLPYLIQAGDRASAIYAWQDALRCYDQALEAAAHAGPEAADPQTCWDLQLKRGAAATPLGDYPAAIGAYEEVLRLAEQDERAPDAPTRANTRRGAQIQAFNGLSYVYGLRNDYTRAREVIRQGTALADASPQLIDRAEVFYQAGLISYRMDDYAEARQFLGEAVKMYEALGLEFERAKCLIEIGMSYMRQDGPTDQVIAYHTQALEVYRRQGDRFGEHLCLVVIANAHLMRGRLAEVVQLVEQCLLFFNTVGAQDSVAECLFLRGEAYRRMGRSDAAIESLHESYRICIQLDRTAAAAFNQVAIAATLRDMGRYDAATAELRHATRVDDRMIRARALLVSSDIAWRIDDIKCAWEHLTKALTLAGRIGSKAYRGIAYRLLAQLRIADTRGRLPKPSRDLPDGDVSFAESIRLLQEAQCEDELALTWLAFGRYLLAAGRKEEAGTALAQAQTLMRQCGMTGALATTQELLRPLQILPTALLPGQHRILLARRGVPRGRPLRADELVEVIWTIDTPNQHENGKAINKVAERQERLRRLCAEAAAQGAEPTVVDLAGALGVTPRTVDRDIALLRAAGEVLATRGSAS